MKYPCNYIRFGTVNANQSICDVLKVHLSYIRSSFSMCEYFVKNLFAGQHNGLCFMFGLIWFGQFFKTRLYHRYKCK